MEPPYDSLSAHQNPHIRLLSLRRTVSEADPICCTITTHELATAPAFECLSYCWGAATQKKPIECNKRSFPVTNNLHSALQHLRNQTKDRVLWINAICINQDDQKERSSQVVLMREIYRRAERVLVWLGPSADASELAYSTLRRLSGYWPEMLERWGREPMSALKLGPYRKTLQRLCGSQGEAQSDDVETDERFHLRPQELVALRAVLERPWWMRLWVVQEVCVARTVTMVCGFESMNWDDFSSGYIVAMAAGGMITRIGSTSWIECCIGLYELKLAFDRMQQRKKISADVSDSPGSLQGLFGTIDMLQMTRLTNSFMASVPHDKIYGIIGLANVHPDEEGLSIVPDYELSVVECYKNAALTMMKQSGSSRVLEDVVLQSLTAFRLEGLPSWVPDWSYDGSTSWESSSWGPASPFAKHLAIGIMSAAMARKKLPFSACPENERCHPRVVEDSILVLEGYIVDTVASTGHALLGQLANDDEERWRLFGEERVDESLFQQLRLFINTCLRVSVFVAALLSWENLAFADPAQKTTSEKETFHQVVQNGNYIRSLETSTQIYAKNWRLLLTWLRRFSFLQVFGRGVGTLTVYNLVLGFVSYISFMRSRSKSHLVTLLDSIGSRLGRTAGGRLARLPHTAQIGDSIALLRGGKYASVIRPKGHRWEVIGPAYVGGIMHGEAWQPSAVREMEFV